jgi:hypothetical protein
MLPRTAKVGFSFLIAILTATLSAFAAEAPPEEIQIEGIRLSLGMPREPVFSSLRILSVRHEGKEDYWSIYSAADTPKWLGSLLFKHGKLALIIKSWAGADDKTMNGVIRNMMGTRESCGFTVAEAPTRNGPLRLTTLACPGRQVVIQGNEDKGAGIVPCDVEVLGDPGNRLKEPGFWKACR